MDENDENDGIYEAETEFQRAVQDALRDQRTGEVTVWVTDNERAVIMEIGDIDAAFTADEARNVADETPELPRKVNCLGRPTRTLCGVSRGQRRRRV